MTATDKHAVVGLALVTGANGFIGRRLVARLAQGGVAVRALVLPDERVRDGWPAEVVRGDIADRAAVERAVAGAGTVFHLAAVVGDWGDEALFQRVTVDGTRNVAEAAAAAGARLVLASSIVVYGDRLGREHCDEDSAFGRALGPYSRSKQAQERLARQLEAERGLALSIVRPGNVFGVASKLWVDEAAVLLRRGMPVLVGDGERDAGLAHVETVAEVLVRAAGPAALGRAYNANDGSGVTWRRYFGDLARAAGARPPRSLPDWAARLGANLCEPLWRRFGLRGRPPMTHESLNLVGSHHRTPNTRAQSELGLIPPVGYGDAMREIAATLR